MPLDNYIRDGGGTKARAYVEEEALAVIERPLPPFSGSQKMVLFSKYLTDDGLDDDGTNQDMRVNGSSTNVEFYREADNDKDTYITILSIVLADQSNDLAKFGALSALTNGCQLEYENQSGIVPTFPDLKTGFDIYRLSGDSPTIYSNVIGANIDAVVARIDFVTTYRFRWGIKLAAGSNQRITFRIRDNLSTGLDQFDVIAYGFEREK